MANIRLLTFDLDDTLWEMKPVLIAAERRVYRWLENHCPELTRQLSLRELAELRWQLAMEIADLKHQISELRRVTLAAVMEQYGVSPAKAKALSEKAFDVFLDARHEVELFEHAEQALAGLARDYTLGALTNGNANIFRLDIGRHFSFAFTAEELNASKPAADHFEHALRSSGQPRADQAIHIGDDPVKDIAAAHQLGWHTIWVNKDNNAWTGEHSPTRTVTCLSELVSAVASIDAEAGNS